jgi:hypothetical protein
MIREASPGMKQADADMLLGMYTKQQELVFANAFNRIQNWLKQEQGEQMKIMASEAIRLRQLPPGKTVDMPQPMRSKAKGIRKATDPSSSPIEGPTGGYSWRGGEGEVGLGQMRAQALNTEDLHQSYITRAYLNKKARESSSVFTTVVTRGQDQIGRGISNVTYAEAGLRQPYIVGKAHDNVNVRMIGGRPQRTRSRSAEEFSEKVSSGAKPEGIVTTNVGKLSADQKVDRVFLRDLIDDLTLMTRPDSEFALRYTSGPMQGQVYQKLARAPMTKASEGLPNNLTRDQAEKLVQTLDVRELQRLEMQHWVDRYGYRMMYDTHYAKSLTELDAIAERAAAAFALGKAPKGFFEILRQTMSQKASMLPTGSKYISPGQSPSRTRTKKYRPPEFRFKGKTSFGDFMDYLSSNIPAGGAARVQGVRGIQFPQ